MSNPISSQNQEFHLPYPIANISTVAQIERDQIPPSTSIASNEKLFESMKQFVIEVIDRISIKKPEDNGPSVEDIRFIYFWNYGNHDDLFHQNVTALMKKIKGMEIQKESFEKIAQQMNQRNMALSVPSIVGDFLYFKENFPEIFEKRGYQKELNYIQKMVCNKFHIAPPKNCAELVEESYQAKDLVNGFKGDILVLGCGRANDGKDACGPHVLDKTLFVSYEESYDPDICADYYSKQFWKLLPDDQFKEVFFEGFAPSACQSSLQEIQRILKEGGKARMHFSNDFVIAHEEGCLEEYFKKCGFKQTQIVAESFLSCGVEKDHRMIHVYK